MVRHLPTAWNHEERLQGRRDVSVQRPYHLDPAVVDRLDAFADAPAACSTLRRTRETAEAYGRPDAVPSPLLDELDFASFEGRSRSELIAETAGLWLANPFECSLGPSLRDLDARQDAFLLDVRRRGSDTVLFGHGVWIRLLVAKVQLGDVRLVNSVDVGPGALWEVVV
jgi:broad specificity phosphatase PhoE